VGSFDSIEELISQPQSARTLITSAAEAVDVTLEMMNTCGKISPLLLPSVFKFLLSSLSFMLLVVSHYPTQYRALCSRPFHAAIDMLNNMQGLVKDPSLDIGGALQELRKLAQVIQLPSPPSPLPKLSAAPPLTGLDSKQGADNSNSTHLGQAFAGPNNLLDEVQMPDSNFFSSLGDVNISQPEFLYMNLSNIFD
jgi:hypothetical protein